MPIRLRTACPVAGCPERLTPGSACPIHGTRQRRRTTRPTPWLQYGRAWQKIRNVVLAEQPRCGCRSCGAPHCCHGRAATAEVHHIQSLRTGGARLERSNLIGLCVPCHRHRTALENARRRRRGVG